MFWPFTSHTANDAAVFATVSSSTSGRWDLAVIRAGDAGLERIANLDHWRFPGPCCFTTAGDEVLFPTRGLDGGRQLWRSDGTSAGTRAFHGPFSNSVSDIAYVGWLDGAAWYTDFRGQLVRVDADGGTSVSFNGVMGDFDETGAWLVGTPTGASSTAGLYRLEQGVFRRVAPPLPGRPRLLTTWKGWLVFRCDDLYCAVNPADGDTRVLGETLTQPAAPSTGLVHGAFVGGQFFLAWRGTGIRHGRRGLFGRRHPADRQGTGQRRRGRRRQYHLQDRPSIPDPG